MDCNATKQFWVLNWNAPDLVYTPKIISFLGYVPTFNENRLNQYRLQNVVSQNEMSGILEIDPITWSWAERRNEKILVDKLD